MDIKEIIKISNKGYLIKTENIHKISYIQILKIKKQKWNTNIKYLIYRY